MDKKPAYEQLEERIRELEREASERKWAEEALRESEEKYRNILQSIEEGYYEVDLAGNLTFFNDSLCKIYGYPRDALMGMNNRDYTDPETAERVYRVYNRVFETGQSGEVFDVQIMRMDGSKRHIEASASLLVDSAGKRTGFRGIVRDVTDRKRAEESLRKSEERYRTILESIEDGYYEVDLAGTFTFLNDSFCRIVGFSEDDLVGVNYRKFTDPASAERVYRVFNRVYSSGEPVKGFDWVIDTKEGTKRYAELSVSLIRDSEGHRTGFRGVIRDVTERRKAQDALRESEERYRTILESIEDGYFEVDIAGNLTFFNDSLCRILGHSKEELMGMNNRHYTDEKNAKKLYTAFNNVYTTGKPSKAFDWEIIRKDGSRRHVEASVSLMKDFEGRRTGFRGIVRDISDLKRVDEELRKTKTYLESILNYSLDVILTVKKDGTFGYFNPQLERLTGYKEQEVRDRHFMSFIPEHQREFMLDKWKEINAGIPGVYETEIVVSDGTLAHCLVSHSILAGFDEFLVTVKDITRRRRAEEALHMEKEKFRALVEESPFGICMMGKDGDYKYINPKFTEMFGYSLEDIPTGKDWFEKAYPDPQYRHRVISLWKRDLEESRPTISRVQTFKVRCKDGSEKVIRFSPAMMESRDQFVVYEDITEQKRLEGKLFQAQKMEAIGTLAGGIAHDFNNILSSVVGYTEIALDDVPKGSSLQNNLQEVLKAAYRARDLVKQILAFSRQAEEERRPLLISPIIKETLKLLRASLPSTIEIRQNIDKDLGPVLTDPTQINQILMNLCTNSAHAMREKGGTLEVGLQKVNIDSDFAARQPDITLGPYLRLTVSDTGHGMTPEVMERIFDPYFTTKEPGEGTGLGLATVHGIVKSHGGTVTFYGEPGKGSTFHVYLPLIEREVVPDTKTEDVIPTGDESILFVDDEQPIVDIGKQIMERLGYEVVARTSSIEALELFRAKPDKFDLVITDMTMPNMTGEELARELMAIRPNIAVILCTGFSEKITEQKAKSMGIQAFVTKPILKGVLAETIRKVLDQVNR